MTERSSTRGRIKAEIVKLELALVLTKLSDYCQRDSCGSWSFVVLSKFVNSWRPSPTQAPYHVTAQQFASTNRQLTRCNTLEWTQLKVAI